MNFRTTFILATIVALVGAYMWLEEAPAPEPERGRTLLGEPVFTSPTQTTQRFFDFAPSEVVAIRLTHQGHTRATERHGNTWAGVARPSTIDDFLQSLSELGAVLEITSNPADLTEYGLQSPQSVVELQIKGAPMPLVLEIGDRNPATTGVYARTGRKGPVILAGALVAWEVENVFREIGGTDSPA
jgi:uncharacterized protein DUF4340